VLTGAEAVEALGAAAAANGTWSAANTQSPFANPVTSASELTSTAVTLPNAAGFSSWIEPAPPAGSCWSTVDTVPASGSAPVRPTSASAPVTPAGSSPSSRRTAGQPPAGWGTVYIA
jgi:hypothetical protein